MDEKSEAIKKYKEYKEKYKKTPKVKEFYEYSGLSRRVLEKIYGDSPYSSLQADCGDEANKLDLERVSV